MTRNQWIGLDLGRSAVKVCAMLGSNRINLSFPTAVMPAARSLVFDELEESAAADSVMLNGMSYWTGATALRQGIDKAPVGRTDEWLIQTDHDALLLSAVKRIRAAGIEFDPGRAVITVGVPSRVAKERRDLVKRVRERVGELLGDGKAKPLVNVVAQPIGVIAAYTMTDGGDVKDGADPDSHSYAVIEIGQHTTDFAAVVEGEPIVSAADSSEGVEVIAAHVLDSLRSELKQDDLELGVRDLQIMMTSPTKKVRGQTINLRPMIERAVADVLAPKILAKAKEVFGRQLLQSADAILLAGGAAPWVYTLIKTDPLLGHTVMLENPREAVAEGFARLAAAVAKA